MNVGVIGLGIMGSPMVDRLRAAGHTVYVYNRHRDKAQRAIEQGALWRDSPGAIAAESEVVITTVTDPSAVEAVSLGAEGILSRLSPESVHCDMSTVTPAWSAHMAEEYARRGRRFVQAPMLGSKRQIAEGTLLIFAGGREEDIARCEGAWSAFAKRIWRMASAEQAACTKLACNMLIGHMIVGLGQAFALAESGGVDLDLLLEILRASALGCPMYANKGKTLKERYFAPNFTVANMLKDMRLVSQAEQEAGLSLPAHGVVEKLFETAVQDGYGAEDYSAVVKTLDPSMRSAAR